MMRTRFLSYRPKPTYPTYPPYHRGAYLEDYFHDRYFEGPPRAGRTLIPVSWTTCYIEGRTKGLQEALDGLDPAGSYFVVSQHDDAVRERLPPDTLRFCAGGNMGGVPIPLVCSPIPEGDMESLSSERDLLCSFCGSMTHPIRAEMAREIGGMPDAVVKIGRWGVRVEERDYRAYLGLALRSRFLLCPRGYGPNSFRLYESFQLGCVPVVVSDVRFLPWEDELDWSEFAVVVKDTKGLYERLKNITEESYNGMLGVGRRLYEDYFSLRGVFGQVMKRI